MSEDYFTRLGSELAARTRDGAHPAAHPPRLARGSRRAAASVALVLALAASLVTEFPATARGSGVAHPPIAAPAAHPLRGA